MASGTEMMLANAAKLLLKHLNLDGEKIQGQVTEIYATVTGFGKTGAAMFSLLLMANRRLHRIETALKLADIEPVPEQLKVIDHVEVASSVVVIGASEVAR